MCDLALLPVGIYPDKKIFLIGKRVDTDDFNHLQLQGHCGWHEI